MAGASALACSSPLMSPNPEGGRRGHGPARVEPRRHGGRVPAAHVAPRAGVRRPIWIMGGQGSDGTLRNDVWSSADGVAWTMATAAAAWSPRELTAGVVYQNKMWMIDGSPRSSEVWTSTDGATWTSVTQAAPFSPRYGHCTLVHNDKISDPRRLRRLRRGRQRRLVVDRRRDLGAGDAGRRLVAPQRLRLRRARGQDVGDRRRAPG